MNSATALPFWHGKPFALFLDIDGTLIEHKPHPDDVFVDEELRNLLIAAGERLQGALALVTGRAAETVDGLFAPLKLPVAGLFGIEQRLKPGEDIAYAEEPAHMGLYADSLQERFRSEAGVYFERKGPVLAVHTRAAPHALADVLAESRAALKHLPEGYRIVPGKAGLEVLPPEALKSAAIERFMAVEPFSSRLPIFIGDDAPDEAGFEFVNAIGGHSIRVRPAGETAARQTLPDVAAARRWIAKAIDSANLSA